MVKNLIQAIAIVLTISLADFLSGLFSFNLNFERLGFWFMLIISLIVILTFAVFIDVVFHKKDTKDYKNLIPKKTKKGTKHGNKKRSGKTKGSNT